MSRSRPVFPSTVSRVFDPSWNGRIREETRRIVLQTANQLGYHGSNALARGLFTQRSGIIAFVIGKSVSDFYIDIVKSSCRCCKNAANKC